jgi:biopolymer transport protein ExbD
VGHSVHEDDSLISGINVTPLVDVVLVLLVVMMVTATYVTSRALPLDPPVAHDPQPSPLVALEVVVDASGRVFVDDRAVDDAALRARAHAYVASTNDARATISADRATPHGEVVRVIDALRDEHVGHFAIRVREIPR